MRESMIDVVTPQEQVAPDSGTIDRNSPLDEVNPKQRQIRRASADIADQDVDASGRVVRRQVIVEGRLRLFQEPCERPTLRAARTVSCLAPWSNDAGSVSTRSWRAS